MIIWKRRRQRTINPFTPLSTWLYRLKVEGEEGESSRLALAAEENPGIGDKDGYEASDMVAHLLLFSMEVCAIKSALDS